MTKRLNIALVAVALLLVLVVVMPVSAYTVRTNIMQGATIFIGETGLNLSQAQTGATYSAGFTGATANVIADGSENTIGWWASAADLQTTSPTKSVSLVGRNLSFTVSAADFVGYAGNWYIVNQSTDRAMLPAIFNVADPTLDVKIWDFGNTVQTNNIDVTGKSIPQGEWLGFKIETNMYNALGTKRFTKNVSTVGATWLDAGGSICPMDNQWVQYNNVSEGYIDIKVKDESGATLNALLNGSVSAGGKAFSITRQNVSFQPWIWGTAPSTYNTDSNPHKGNALGQVTLVNWTTNALDTNQQYAYPPGTYTITAESQLNGMKDEYKNAGADYTGKTVSQAVTVTLVSDAVKVEANKDSVVRSKSFSVTVTGKPNTVYHIWVKGTSSMTGAYDSQPPMIKKNQAGITQDAYDTTLATGAQPQIVSNSLSAGGYLFENGNGKTIGDDVATGRGTANEAQLGNGTFVYANVTLSTSGTRTVEFTTSNWTKAQRYTIRVEQRFPIAAAANRGTAPNAAGSSVMSDEVDVKVEKGAVTIVAAGDQSYYLGEEIKFSGTNTETYQTYLFIVGPNLNTAGAQIAHSNPRDNPVVDQQANTFKAVDVNGDNTWSWKWGTSAVALDAGTYTIYAVSQPRSNSGTNLAQASFGTVSIIIKKPFVSATASQSTVAQGDKLFITGTAEGNPKGVQIWILGKNYPTNVNGIVTESVNADASFKYELAQGTTRNLYPGQYFVVVQHPMQNDEYDIRMDPTAGSLDYVQNRMLNAGAGIDIFRLFGAGSLQGSDAAEALVQGINDPNVDDTYTKLQFLIEVPVIRIDPVGDKRVGDKFTITAQTNLAVDDEVLVEVYSSSFKPTQKSQSGEFSGATGTVKVTKGDSGMNKISFDVDSSTFKPDEYIVQADAVIQVATGTALFNVLEGSAPTAAPTVVVTTVAPVVTTAAPVITTAAPTPVPTTKSPGYGALIALIGLGAVAFIVVRRH